MSLRAWTVVSLVAVSALVACAEPESATESANLDTVPTPTAEQLGWATSLRASIDAMEGNVGIAPSLHVDTNALYTNLEAELFRAPASPGALIGVLRKAILAYPSGHLSFSTGDNHCYDGTVAMASSSRLGVCTQPFGDHAVVSDANPNPLGLVAGDEILAVDGRRAGEMMRVSLEQPMCTTSSASPSHRRFIAGTSLLAGAKEGTTIEVRHIDGSVETKTVSQLGTFRACRDPFGRRIDFVARAWKLGDIGIVRVPSLTLPELEGETPAAKRARIHAELLAAFQEVRGARGIVWDLRANGGGSTPSGLEVVAGFPGAKLGAPLAKYALRTPNTDEYGQAWTTSLPAIRGDFAYDGKVAILIDGLAMSAADYTMLGARNATGAFIVGSPSAGAFGGGGQHASAGTAPAVSIRTDPGRATDLEDRGIEGNSIEPTHPIELTPQDLARGVDTVLEAAISLVR